jgi:catechol 2,3-dioxygenase-like lactoylglutathione lyase family enzyme
MLHHVTLEVRAADLERSVEFWELLGFARVDAPAQLADTFTWLEREGTQIHLMRTEQPTVPEHGHAAVVAPRFEETAAALAEHGFELRPKRRHWGAARAEAIAPGGHRVELMAAPPRG